MSDEYKHSSNVPNEKLCLRLDELAHAVTKGHTCINKEFYMSIPAQLDVDADCVLSESANRIRAQDKEITSLRAELERKRAALEKIARGGAEDFFDRDDVECLAKQALEEK